MYPRMIGTMTKATSVINPNVSSLAVASHIVKLWFGRRLEGIMNGNIDKPTVNTTPKFVRLENQKAKQLRPNLEAKEDSTCNNQTNTG